MKEYKVDGHVSSYLPEGKEWKLVWNDEFDGPELDTSKWSFRLNFWGKPFDAYTDRGIKFDGNSNIELHRTERNGYYVSPQLQTGSNSFDIPKSGNENPWGQNDFWPLGVIPEPKFMHRFGFYECRCKFQNEPEIMWSAFWTQAPGIGTTYDPKWSGVESDIMECFEKGKVTSGNIMGGYGNQLREESRIKYDLKETADGYHVFAMEWTPDEYVFYCDGEVTARADENISLVPQFILLTTEVQGYRHNAPVKTNGSFTDDAFIVDYVRVFDALQ